MGVMACSRNGCENVMCDLLSNKYGYICGDCHTELYNRIQDISKFMESEKVEDSEFHLVQHQERVAREFTDPHKDNDDG